MRAVVIAQIILSLFLMAAILLQSKGTGLGRAWGGEGGFYHTKKGMEKALFMVTVFLSLLFFVVAIINFILY